MLIKPKVLRLTAPSTDSHTYAKVCDLRRLNEASNLNLNLKRLTISSIHIDIHTHTLAYDQVSHVFLGGSNVFICISFSVVPNG